MHTKVNFEHTPRMGCIWFEKMRHHDRFRRSLGCEEGALHKEVRVHLGTYGSFSTTVARILVIQKFIGPQRSTQRASSNFYRTHNGLKWPLNLREGGKLKFCRIIASREVLGPVQNSCETIHGSTKCLGVIEGSITRGAEHHHHHRESWGDIQTQIWVRTCPSWNLHR